MSIKELVKRVYESKIRFIYYWNLGYGEFATPIAVVRDIGITLGLLKWLFNLSFGWKWDVVICIVCFLAFYIIGRILVGTKMIQFSNKLSNSYNPELVLINKIWEKLNG